VEDYEISVGNSWESYSNESICLKNKKLVFQYNSDGRKAKIKVW